MDETFALVHALWKLRVSCLWSMECVAYVHANELFTETRSIEICNTLLLNTGSEIACV